MTWLYNEVDCPELHRCPRLRRRQLGHVAVFAPVSRSSPHQRSRGSIHSRSGRSCEHAPGLGLPHGDDVHGLDKVHVLGVLLRRQRTGVGFLAQFVDMCRQFRVGAQLHKLAGELRRELPFQGFKQPSEVARHDGHGGGLPRWIEAGEGVSAAHPRKSGLFIQLLQGDTISRFPRQ